VAVTEPTVQVSFSGEEADGRYLDIHELHDK
jgi:hypothetical protein